MSLYKWPGGLVERVYPWCVARRLVRLGWVGFGVELLGTCSCTILEKAFPLAKSAITEVNGLVSCRGIEALGRR